MSNFGESILKGAREALAYAQGEADESEYRVNIPERLDVKAIRKRLEMTQVEFSASFGISVNTIQHWEHGTRTPEGPARAYLTVIERDPESVRQALQPAAQSLLPLTR